MSKASISSSPSTESCSSHYIYLIQTREFIKTNEPVYKIGKTTQDGMNRIKQYPKGSRIILFMKCNNCHTLERVIKEKFIKKYKVRRDIGSEYFEGDEKNMYCRIIGLLLKDMRQDKEEDDSDESNEEESDEEKSDEESDEEASESDFSSEDKESNEYKIEEQEEHEEEIIVSSYEDYMKYSKIKEIIITSKKTHEGYLRFENQLWRYLHNIKHSERNGQETLDGFIKNNNSESLLYRDTVTKKIGTIADMKDSRNLRLVNINYRYDSIIKDIVEKCYQSHPNKFVPEYHQFFVHSSDESHVITKLFDAKRNTFDSIEPYIAGKYTTISESCRSIRTDVYDTCIVDDIMRQLIPLTRNRNNYRQLCRYMLVDSISSPYIFRDTCYFDTEHHQLSSWLCDMTYTLGIESIPQFNLEGSRLKKQSLSTFIKEYNATRARCVCLMNIHENDIEKCVSEIREKLGIMLFIVRNKTRDRTQSIYDFNAYEKYMRENIEIVKQNIKRDEYRDTISHKDLAGRDMDDLFYLTYMLFTHYMKWCITH